jgi:hypothetical protein
VRGIAVARDVPAAAEGATFAGTATPTDGGVAGAGAPDASVGVTAVMLREDVVVVASDVANAGDVSVPEADAPARE